MARFSIIITCYNQASFIRDAVGSALAQDHGDQEVIVVDDGSTDASRKVLEEYGDAIRFKPLETNQGACSARNHGASMATGDFLVFLDGDDLLLPWALETYARIIDLKQPKLILGSMVWFENSYSSVNLATIQKEIAIVDYQTYMKKDRTWRTSASALVVGRESFENAGRWTDKFFPMEDHDLVYKLGYAGRTIQIMSPPTTAYRMHAANSTHQIRTLTEAIIRIMHKEKTGQYPGGAAGRFERHAVIGGVAYAWLKRALKVKLYGRVLKIISAGGWMIVAAVLRRGSSVLTGKRPVEKLGILSHHDEPVMKS